MDVLSKVKFHQRNYSLIIEQISKIGLNEICLADTIGVATPKDIKAKLKAIKSSFPNLKVRLHLHNTRNTGIANAWAGIEEGVMGLESSFGGSGGCPFALEQLEIYPLKT